MFRHKHMGAVASKCFAVQLVQGTDARGDDRRKGGRPQRGDSFLVVQHVSAHAHDDGVVVDFHLREGEWW